MTTLAIVNLLLYMPVRSRDDFVLMVRTCESTEVNSCDVLPEPKSAQVA